MFLAIAYMFTDPMITLTDMFSAWETMCAGQLRSMTWATGDMRAVSYTHLMQNCNFSDKFVSETRLKILILSAGMDACHQLDVYKRQMQEHFL